MEIEERGEKRDISRQSYRETEINRLREISAEEEKDARGGGGSKTGKGRREGEKYKG
jgi:hypothetical protein